MLEFEVNPANDLFDRANVAYQGLKQDLLDEAITFDCNDETLNIVWSYKNDGLGHRQRILFNATDKRIYFCDYFQFDVGLTSPHYNKTLAAINAINRSICYGSFYIDYDGQIIFQYFLYYGMAEVHRESTLTLLKVLCHTAIHFASTIYAVSRGYLQPESVVDKEHGDE